jgi:hypothetical protein
VILRECYKIGNKLLSIWSMYKKLLIIILLTFQISLAIAAFLLCVYVPNDCWKNVSSVGINYFSYVIVFGLSNMFGSIIYAPFVIRIFQLYEPDCRIKILVFVCCPILIFQFVWYVLGTISYFQTVYNICPNDSVINSFGLILFVLQAVQWDTVILVYYIHNNYQDREIIDMEYDHSMI